MFFDMMKNLNFQEDPTLFFLLTLCALRNV